jgi:hypothetical protein
VTEVALLADELLSCGVGWYLSPALEHCPVNASEVEADNVNAHSEKKQIAWAGRHQEISGNDGIKDERCDQMKHFARSTATNFQMKTVDFQETHTQTFLNCSTHLAELFLCLTSLVWRQVESSHLTGSKILVSPREIELKFYVDLLREI